MNPEAENYDWLNVVNKTLALFGFDNILMIGGRCPFQMELGHESGIYVYFRARGSKAEIEAYNVDPSDPRWIEGLPPYELSLMFAIAQYWLEDSYAAGYIEPDEALYVFYQLWSDIKDFILE
ncbi:hypothetical protein [Nodosilinea nodulosa]|uniref:hypothetical protein n=1 Tax=Nodosilinea nodulosa TaxID=416001 RepID=UPI0002E94011|nr:hypothetical protein [Nodosilinea nodulosa]